MSDGRGVMMQYFHWYEKDDGSLYKRLAHEASVLAKAGFTALWLPPAYKGVGGAVDVGYGVYDLYDLGEFDQKGSVRTKYGTRRALEQAIGAAHAHGLQIYADVVLNHRMGADETEVVRAVPYARDNRSEPKGEPLEIEAYTRFTFPGRNGVHSDFTWHWQHFDAVDHDGRQSEEHATIYVFEGKTFDDYVSAEFGNYDYLMGCDLDFESEEVREELLRWGTWFLDATAADGFRIDAVKHIPSWFFPPWLSAMRAHAKKELFAVAEYWEYSLDSLKGYIDRTEGSMSLFDVPLHGAFHKASRSGADFDLRTIFDGTLVHADPAHAVTFVANHDSQALQALESVVEPWFKPLAYALILLRREGYPCVFAADYHGASYTDSGSDGNQHTIEMPSFKQEIDAMLALRHVHTFGDQHDYFDHGNVIGWTFGGDEAHPGAMAVLMSNGDAGEKRMEIGKPGKRFRDAVGRQRGEVVVDDDGYGNFTCDAQSVSVWVELNS